MAPLSQVEICNLAIARLGETKQITDITEAGRAASMCNLHYDHVREMALARGDWNFARKRETLTAESGDPPDEWEYQYQVPSDCLAARKIVTGQYVPTPENVVPFTQEWDDTSSKVLIYTNHSAPDLIYTYNITNEALFERFFSDFFAWWLAMEIAIPVTGQRAKRSDAAQGRQMAWMYALSHNVVTDPLQWLGLVPGPGGLSNSPTVASRLGLPTNPIRTTN
jgi:hypothetical protein